MGSILSADFGPDSLEVQQLQTETGFSRANIKRLYHRFDHLDKEKKGYLTKKDLMAIPEIHFNPIGERIVGSFFPSKYTEDGELDDVASERVYFYDFAKHFAVFRQVSSNENRNLLNTKMHKIRFLFDLIDDKRLGQFNREELFDVLEMMIGVNIDHEQLEHIVDRVIAEADTNEDGFISFEEFEKAITKIDVEQKMAFIGFK